MSLPAFEYRAARSVEEALALFAERPGARYMAGGTDLLAQARIGRKSVTRVVDINRIPSLLDIVDEGGGLSIGAAISMNAVAAHPAVRQRYPVLADCCNAVGAYPLRNRATVAGNICNASPAADSAAALIALEAVVRVTGPSGDRAVPATAFFTGPGATVLLDGEMVTSIFLPPSSSGWAGVYLRLSRRKGMDLATVAVLVTRSGPSCGCSHPCHHVALVAVAPTPLRCPEAEAILDNGGPDFVKRTAEAAMAACSPITDLRGTAEYRREMVGVLLEDALSALAVFPDRHLVEGR